MWPTIFEFAGIASSVIFCSIAVKLADDFLDKDIDSSVGCYNFAQKLGPGATIYGMLSLAVAAGINASVSLPLFFASYSIGMLYDLKQVFPSGLNGIHESLLVFIVGVILWSWQNMLFSILFILSIQLLDDYIDIYIDKLVGYRNLAYRLGKVECLLLSMILMLTAWNINEHLFAPVFIGTAISYSIILYCQRRT